MTLLWMDGFDMRDTLIRSYASAGANGWATGRFGSGSCVGSSTAGTAAVKKVVTANATLIAGIACGMSVSGLWLAFYGDGGATEHVRIQFNTDGSVNATRAGTALTGGSLPAGTVTPLNTWHYFEAKVTVSDTVGTIEIRVDGSPNPIMNLSGLDTKNNGTNTTLDAVMFTRSGGGSGTTYYDDFYICDTNGSVNNDFLGDVRVVTLNPDGNGNYSQFVGSDGNSTDNYLLVDESPAGAYTTADYVGSPTSGNRDTYTMSDLTGTPTVLAVQEVAVVLKSDAGAMTLKQAMRVGGTDYETSAVTLGTSAASITNIREQNPNTSAAWTASGVNGVEVGVRVG